MKRIPMIVREFRWAVDIGLSSLNKGLFHSIFSKKVHRNIFSVSSIRCSVQLAHQRRMAIFIEGEAEVGIPTIVEGRPYPLGGFLKRGKQEAKGGRLWLFSQTSPYDSPMKLL